MKRLVIAMLMMLGTACFHDTTAPRLILAHQTCSGDQCTAVPDPYPPPPDTTTPPAPTTGVLALHERCGGTSIWEFDIDNVVQMNGTSRFWTMDSTIVRSFATTIGSHRLDAIEWFPTNGPWTIMSVTVPGRYELPCT